MNSSYLESSHFQSWHLSCGHSKLIRQW